jgi:hypothetical protein
MKRFLATGFVVCLLLFVGCGGDRKSGGAAPTTDPATGKQATEKSSSNDRTKTAASPRSEDAAPLSREAIESIHRLVWSGFYSADEILPVIAEEMYELDDAATLVAGKEIARQFDEKAHAEKTWTGRITCDRLDSLFEDLNKSGIIALQNAGYTVSDGISEMTERYEELGGEKSGIVGYCLYHGQDLERAVDGKGLLLTFGDIRGDDEKGLKVGETIRDKAVEQGFKVEWDGSIATRIQLAPFEWQRRGPSER